MEFAPKRFSLLKSNINLRCHPEGLLITLEPFESIGHLSIGILPNIE